LIFFKGSIAKGLKIDLGMVGKPAAKAIQRCNQQRRSPSRFRDQFDSFFCQVLLNSKKGPTIIKLGTVAAGGLGRDRD
jgi:hypothetical protein